MRLPLPSLKIMFFLFLLLILMAFSKSSSGHSVPGVEAHPAVEQKRATWHKQPWMNHVYSIISRINSKIILFLYVAVPTAVDGSNADEFLYSDSDISGASLAEKASV
ncbi:hypothetical protein CRG98_042668, partial [Punica granatum]